MNVFAMRMKSGEEVIFRTEVEFSVLEQSTSKSKLIEIDKPVNMMPVENKVTFVPWIFFSKSDKFTINTENVIVFYRAQEQIESEYRRMTSGIIAPALA